MITGTHIILFSLDAEADRAFLADVLDLPAVDAGGGWLIFALPPAEAAVHPGDQPSAGLYLMSDDLGADMARLIDKGVSCAAVEEARWGTTTRIALPSGTEIGLYQPKHPTALGLGA